VRVETELQGICSCLETEAGEEVNTFKGLLKKIA
jgi:hypothetical protein